MWEGSLSGRINHEAGAITDEYRLSHSLLNETLNELLSGAVAHSDYANLYVADIAFEKLGDALAAGGPDQVKLSISWETIVAGRGQPSPFVQNVMSDWSESWHATGEAITVGEGFVWASDANNVRKQIKNEDISAVMIFPTATFTLTGKTNRFDSDAKNYILAAQGRLNEKNFTLNGYVYESDHVLFDTFSAEPGKDIFGSDVHTLNYSFVYRKDNDWNHFWRKDRLAAGAKKVPGWHSVITETDPPSDGVGPYATIPFSDIDPKNWNA